MKKIIIILLFFCFIIGCDNQKKEMQNRNQLLGTWIADGTQFVILHDNNYNQSPDLDPYYLEFHDNSTFKLTMGEDIIEGNYQQNEDGSIYLISDLTNICNLKDTELNCNMYASKFVKKD